MEHDGGRKFAIWLLDSQGNMVELLVNEIGSFNGSKAIGITEPGTYILDVSADGNWSVAITQVAPASELKPPITLSGSGQQASPFFNVASGLTIFEMEHDGQSNFAIWLLDSEGNMVDLLVNKIGSFNGSKAIGIAEPETYILDISADANWTVDISQEAPASELKPPITLSGSGQQASPFFNVASGLTIFEMEHDGQSNFAIWLLDSEGNMVDLLVNEIGSFNGSKAIGIAEPETYILDISADGNWTVDISQEAPASELKPPITLSGSGQQASPFFNVASGLTIFEMEHDGQSNFAIWLLDSEGNMVDLLVNEIGSFNGSKAIGITEPGTYILDVSADGNWTVAIEQ